MKSDFTFSLAHFSLKKRHYCWPVSNLSPMKMSVVIHLKHVHLFAHNKLNLWLPSCLLVATDSAHWVTTFHLSKLSPRFYNIRTFCVWASGAGPARALPLSPSKAIKPVSTDPAIYCDSGGLLISFIKHTDWRWAKKVCSVIMASHKFTHTHTHGQSAGVPCVMVKMLHMARLSYGISLTWPGVTTLWWCPYLSLGF